MDIPTARCPPRNCFVPRLCASNSLLRELMLYSTTRLPSYEADVANPELATTSLGLVNVAITFAAVKYMDVAGRKRSY
ncbi:hypothetical protein ACHAWO_001929 [Cyclotella atomus]|uniref:Uncharacterized protein n=1 Tax=Cyclotella atomus TaxID=382360 RepID=A0ABD3NKV4_9STRA